MIRKNIFLLSLLIILLAACGGKRGKTGTSVKGEEVKLSFAQGFSIVHADKYTVLTVFNPWQKGKIYDRYYLVKNESTSTPPDGRKVVVPLKTVMANSATHIGFLDAIGETSKVIGICNADYIYNPTILAGVKSGKVKDLGEAFNLNIEHLLMLHPQAVFTTAYNAEDENSRKMRQSGLPIIYNIEWQEPTLLGRAEWIKFMAAFFDKEKEADAIFNKVVTQYNKIKALAQTAKTRPTVMSGQDFRGTWSLPGGRSYTGQLFHDAHTSYLFASDTTRSTIPSNVEEVLIKFHNVDLWIGSDAHNIKELDGANPKYRLFKAYRNHQVYNANKRSNIRGGNDYWESGVVRPDLLLSDMLKIAHPELMPQYQLTYMKKLQ
jgi:iron complex transport system substrate-binding protein